MFDFLGISLLVVYIAQAKILCLIKRTDMAQRGRRRRIGRTGPFTIEFDKLDRSAHTSRHKDHTGFTFQILFTIVFPLAKLDIEFLPKRVTTP
jgi:hypothetical protein